MATILDRYGVKEVMDGTFYQITEDGNIGAPVLYLDSLKVSTVEQTAENTSARGGKGNVELVSWDFNKEITVTLEDALFSAKSLAIMYGSVNADGEAVIDNAETIYRTFRVDQIEMVRFNFAVARNLLYQLRKEKLSIILLTVLFLLKRLQMQLMRLLLLMVRLFKKLIFLQIPSQETMRSLAILILEVRSLDVTRLSRLFCQRLRCNLKSL